MAQQFLAPWVGDEQAWFWTEWQRSERKAKFLRERSSKEFYASLDAAVGV